jgi:hypothetical protein
MKKLKLFKAKRELDKGDKNYLQKQIDELKATLFKINNPNGLLDYSWRGYNSYLYVGVSYAYNNKISGARLYVSNEDVPYVSYKLITKENQIYIGLKYEKDEGYYERYFIVDMNDNKSIECTNQDIMKTITWVQINQ